REPDRRGRDVVGEVGGRVDVDVPEGEVEALQLAAESFDHRAHRVDAGRAAAFQDAFDAVGCVRRGDEVLGHVTSPREGTIGVFIAPAGCSPERVDACQTLLGYAG